MRRAIADRRRRGRRPVDCRVEGLEDRCLLSLSGSSPVAAPVALVSKISAVAPKVDPTLSDLYQQFLAPATANNTAAAGDSAWGSPNQGQPPKSTWGDQDARVITPELMIQGGRVVIQATAVAGVGALEGDLARLGFQLAGAYGSNVSGWLPIESIARLSGLTSLRMAKPAYRPVTNVGAVTSEGDAAQRSNIARGVNNYDGAGVTVGILSDSFNAGGGYADDVASGDLPAGVQILNDLGPFQGSDEGRAMAQIVHDVAPGASLAFASAVLGEASFAQNILALASQAGADVITDDVFYYDEPFFQDGIIAQAVNQVVAQGVSYFSSAGNFGRDAYESTFRDSGVFDPQTGLELHDFDPGPGVDTSQHFTIPFFGGFTMILQWDQPFASATPGGAGSANDVDVYLRDNNGNIVAAGNSGNIGGDPVEIFSFTNFDFGNSDFTLQIGNFAGPTPGRLKYVLLNGGSTVDEFATNTGASFGHADAAGAAGVGAAPYFATPAFGVNPPQIESFSSAGGTAFLFDAAGNRLAAPQLRQQPRFVAPDGVSTTVPGFEPFFGTSAAAPSAAAVAALMVQANPALTPDQIYGVLQSTSQDMDDPATPGFDAGFDPGTGFGLIRADAAVAAVRPSTAISGEVFSDANNNGARDAFEAPLAGVTVFLDTNNNGVPNTGERKTTTDALGRYNFTGLAAGTYRVRQVLPAGYTVVAPAGGVKVLNLVTNQALFADFADSKAVSIVGHVFNDFNGDGVAEPGDGPVPDALVFLDKNGNNKFDRSEAVRSGPSSAVNQFDSLTFVPLSVSGLGTSTFDLNLTVHLSFPTANFDGYGVVLISPAGTTIEVAPPGAPGPGFFDTTFDDQADTIIFAGAPPYTGPYQPASPLSAFNGEDPNGTWFLVIENPFQTGAGSVDSWSLDITTASEPFTKTDSQGDYAFVGLAPGTYHPGILAPPGLAQSLPATPVYNLTGAIGQALRGDFGLRDANAIVGRVVVDSNADGVADAAEPGLPGALVYIDMNNDGIRQGFTSSPDVPLAVPPSGTGGTGDPSLDITRSSLPISGIAGSISDVKVTLTLTHTYDSDLIISLISPSGTQIVLSLFNGGSGDDFLGTTFDDSASTSIDFGSAPFAGSFQPDEPLSTFAGEGANGTWVLQIEDTAGGDSGTLLNWGLNFNNAPVEPFVTTDALGRYRFLGKDQGSYAVRLEPPAGYAQTYPSAGGAQLVTLAAGGLAYADFGARATDAIVGVVFRDLNDNAARNPGEPGLPGVTVFNDLNGNGKFDQGTTSIGATGLPLVVDNGASSTIDSTINVSLGQSRIVDLNVEITLTFPDENFDGYSVTLISPTGVRLVLAPEGAPGPGFLGTIFDDQAPSIIFAGSPPYSGPYRPASALSTFNGQDANGAWTLEIANVFGAPGTGQLSSWSLQFTTSEPQATTDALGNYAFAGLAPGPYTIGVVPPPGLTPNGPASGLAAVNLTAGSTVVSNFSLKDDAAPQVIDVRVNWGVQSISLASLAGRTLPWSSISSFDVVFSEDVQVDAGDFALTGIKAGSYPFAMTYNPATHTASLRLPAGRAFDTDRIGLTIDGDAAGHVGVNDGVAGRAGNFLGNQSYTLNVLVGDVDGNGVVNVIDALAIRTDMTAGVYDPFADLNGDGVVDTIDFNLARSRNGTKKA